MQLTLALSLPTDAMTVPVARHILRSSMREVGVDEDCLISIEVALSEACTNVLKHADPGDEYEVVLDLDAEKAVIRVKDTGTGFDFESLEGGDAPDTSEQGRGVEMMKALVDRVQFTSIPESGTIVHLEKALEFQDSSVLRKLGRSSSGRR